MTTALSPNATPTIVPSHDEIAQCARELWAEAGQPRGRDAEFWLVAEHRLLSACRAPDVSAVILATWSQPVTRPRSERYSTPGEARRHR
ncbi:MAG: DUF2934 domain-containing protein [Opitutaceae bacterium]